MSEFGWFPRRDSGEEYVGDLISRAQERANLFAERKREELKDSILKLREIGEGGSDRAFVYMPIEGANNTTDFRFLFDDRYLDDPLPEAPEGYMLAAGLPMPQEMAASLAVQLEQESGLKGVI